METFSALLPSQRLVARSFDVFFDLHLNKPLSEQSWDWWFETPSLSLWRHCNELLNSQNTTYILPTWASNGVSTVRLLENIHKPDLERVEKTRHDKCNACSQRTIFVRNFNSSNKRCKKRMSSFLKQAWFGAHVSIYLGQWFSRHHIFLHVGFRPIYIVHSVNIDWRVQKLEDQFHDRLMSSYNYISWKHTSI